MNEQSYEQYIRSILGYSDNNIYDNSYVTNSRQTTNNDMLEECYPEIYKIVYPMVTTACNNNTVPVTRELVENLTDEIYSAVETNTEIGINITLKNEVKTNHSMSNNVKSEPIRRETKMQNSNDEREKENRGEDRQIGNRGLRDLIKILLIRELIGRPGFPGQQRPPFPPRPRPPFPGGPNPGPGPGPGPRPPIMPRSNWLYEDLYE